MSFGCSVGDVVSISTLAWKVFKSCKDASEDFKTVSGEVVSLHVVLKESEELVAENNLSASQSTQLRHLADGCRHVLDDLEQLLNKYKSLGTKSQRTWDRVKWGAEDIKNIRGRLVSNTTLLSAYNTTMVNLSMARLERKLNQFIDEVRNGKREGSVISAATEHADVDSGYDESWMQLRRELEDVGVSPDVLSQHRQFIVSWFQRALTQEQEIGTPNSSRPATPSPRNEEDDDSFRRHDITLPPVDSQATLVPETGGSDMSRRQKGNALAGQVKHITFQDACESLIETAEKGDIETMSHLLQRGVDVNYHEMDCMPALNLAAMFGHAEVARLLLKQPGIRLDIKNRLGHTPLSLASWYGHDEIVELLLENPATKIDPTDKEWGQTPLSLATEQGNTPIVRQLLFHGANPNSRDKDGRTPLSWAAEKGRSEETKLLLAADNIDPNLSDRRGITPLAQAVGSGNDVIVRLLLSCEDVDMDTADASGSTPFDRAMHGGYSDMMYIFEQARARRGRQRC